MLSATERLTELFNKHLEAGLSPEEKQEMSVYAMQEELQPLLRQLIGDSWNKTGEEEDLPLEKVLATQDYILSEQYRSTEIVTRSTIRFRWWAAAAVLLFLLAGSTYWYFQPDHTLTPSSGELVAEDIRPGTNGAILTFPDGRRIELDSMGNGLVAEQSKTAPPVKGQPMYQTITTPRGKQFHLQLPDGSRVWLNTASSITYPVTFSGSARQVSITGEVYFEVKTLPSRPFVVTCDQQQVTVLGTRFNINSYEDDATVKTTLRDGKVRVTVHRNGNEKILLPGQQTLVDTTGLIQVREIDVEQALAWQMGYFNFTNTAFSEIMQQLSRWYDIEVRYEHKVPQIEFEGRLNQSVNLSRVLEFFKESGVKFRLENHTLIIQ
jgi:hypothetical protein